MKSKSKKSTPKKYSRTVSGKLLSILLPIIAIVIIGLIVLLTTNARSIITTQANNRLIEETKANANSIGNTITGEKTYLDAVGDTMEKSDIAGDDVIMGYMTSIMANISTASDAYLQ